MKRVALTAVGSWLILAGLWAEYVRRHWRGWVM
jgi:hypothetical protein